jgi:hypothetical protein
MRDLIAFLEGHPAAEDALRHADVDVLSARGGCGIVVIGILLLIDLDLVN